MKTRTYLAAIILTVLLPIFALSAWGLDLLLEKEKEARLLAVEEKTRAIALSIDKELTSAEGALRVIAQTEMMMGEDFPALYALMRKTITSADSWGVLYDADGRMLLHTHHPYGTVFSEGPNPWVREAIARKALSVSNLRDGRAGKWKVVSVNIPIVTAGGHKYLLSHTYHVSYMTKLLRLQELPRTWVVGVFGEDGITIARNLRDKEFVGRRVKPELFRAAQGHATGRIQNRTRDGFLAYNTFTHTTRAAWTVAVAAPVGAIDGPARTATIIAALVLGAAFAAAVLGIFVFAKRITSSFNLTLAAAKLLEQGGIPRVEPSGVVEADMLQRALHDAGAKLAAENAARQRLEAERELLLRSEREARREAENQNTAKDEFLAMLAHELRNPLAPIVAAAHMLKLPHANGPTLERTSNIIIRQADHLKSLIHDLLDVSRVTRGLVEIDRQPVNVGAIVKSAVEQAQPLIDARGHALHVDVRSPDAMVLGDEHRLIQVVANLLNNAAKYTPPGGRIDLGADIEGGELRITVADNGIGIAPDLLPQVFDLFRQASRAADRSQGGLGLGLALVRSIMTLHGGRVEGHSGGIGQGARFTLVLPVFAARAGEAPLHQEPSIAAAAPTELMIVDDNLDAARTLAGLLEAKGHQVTVRASAGDALAHSRNRPLPLYILDIGLPDMDGYALARQLRANAGTGGAVLIALTGYGQMHDQEMACAAGFDHHFVKPIDITALDRILASTSRATAPATAPATASAAASATPSATAAALP